METFLKSILPISLFGLIGIFSRYFLMQYFNRHFPSQFPLSTFIINLFGSFLIGIVYIAAVERTHISPHTKIALMTGLLGGFTTFSAFSLETFLLFGRGKIGYALCYFTLSPLLGVLFSYLGICFARKIL